MNYLKIILIFINILFFSNTYGQCCVLRTGGSPANDINIHFSLNYQPNVNNGGQNKPNIPSLYIQYSQYLQIQQNMADAHNGYLLSIADTHNKKTSKNFKEINRISENLNSIKLTPISVSSSINHLEEFDEKRKQADENFKERLRAIDLERERQDQERIVENKRFEISYFKIENQEVIKENVINGIQSSQFIDAKKQIREVSNLYNILRYSPNNFTEYQKNEITDILNATLNEEGLIKNYIPYYPKLENFQFKNFENNRKNISLQKEILIRINSALHIIKNSYSPFSIEKAEIVVENGIRANQLLSENKYSEAYRVTSRNTVNIAYITQTDLQFYSNKKTSNESNNYFDLNINANSYENYSIIDLSNSFSKELNKNFSTGALLQADLLLKTAQHSSHIQNSLEFEQDLDNGWAFFDTMVNISKGSAKGVYQVAEDTITGLYGLVTHPIDSIEAITSAIYNYDETWTFITNKIRSDINQFPHLNTEEKAKFITETAASIATLITPRGLIKSTAELEKIARASSFATFKVVEKYSHLFPPSGYTPLVNGGGLFAHEAAGGHLIRKHVGWSDIDLKNRAILEKREKISSFSDLNTAEEAVSKTIHQNKSKIDAWLKDANPVSPKPFISYDPINKSVGKLYNKHSDTFEEVSNVKVVLIKDKNIPEGYKILTGFPHKK